MKNILFALAVAGSFWVAPDFSRAGQTVSPAKADVAVVARVNGEPVTRAELTRVLADPLGRKALQQRLGLPDPDAKGLERLALRELIRRRLFIQEAGRRNVTVTEQELDQALSALRRRFGDLREFGAWMKERGLDDRSLLATLRAEIVTGRVWAALVKDVRVTEEQVREYYEAHKDELILGEEVRLRIIAVKDRASADEIMAALEKGENFIRLARMRSLGTRAAQGGDTGWVDSRTLPPPMQKAVAALKEGEATGPVQRGADEFLVIGLQGRRPLKAKSPAEARPEIERRLLPAKRQEFIEAWATEQETRSKIELLSQTESSTNAEATSRGGQ